MRPRRGLVVGEARHLLGARRDEWAAARQRVAAPIDRQQRDAEVGYRVAPWARGRGVASDAVAAASRWAFAALDLVRIELAHALENPASCRVADKAGFLLEGTLRQAFVYGDGQRHDEHLHARLVTD